MKKKSKFVEALTAVLHVGLGYLKAQLIFFGINFGVMTICFIIFGLPVPPLIALGISVMDILPIVGSGIVFLPWIIVCLIIGNTTLGIQLAVLYIGLIVLRQVLEPFILGKHIGVRPIITFAAGVLGLLIFGAPGLIVGPVIAAIFNAVYRVYTKNTAGMEEDIRKP